MIETGQLTLTDFLLARIAEDEAAARTCNPAWWPVKLDDSGVGADDEGTYFAQADLLNSMTPARVLAECEAKRRIVEAVTENEEMHERYGEPTGDLGDTVLSTLALPYADHPDYRAEFAV